MAKEFLTAQEVLTRVDDQRRDPSDTPVDDSKKMRALNAILDIISSRASFRFAVRAAQIAFYAGQPLYNIQNQFGLDDFMDLKDVRPEVWAGRILDNVEADEWARMVATGDRRPFVSINTQDNYESLWINWYDYTKPEVILATQTDVDSWLADTAGSDATNLHQDIGYFKYGNASLAFDIDVSQSVNNYARVYDAGLGAVDFSDHLNLSHGFQWVYIPATLVDYITSVKIEWGQSASAYWHQTKTTPANGDDWKAGWNLVEVAWDAATKVGSPDEGLTSFAAISVIYSASCPDITGVRVSKLSFSRPEFMELWYYSRYLVKDATTGARKRQVEALEDKLLVPTEHKETLVEGVLWQVMDQMGSNNSSDSQNHLKLFEYGYDKDEQKTSRAKMGGMQLLLSTYGVKKNSGKRRFRINPAVED